MRIFLLFVALGLLCVKSAVGFHAFAPVQLRRAAAFRHEAYSTTEKQNYGIAARSKKKSVTTSPASPAATAASANAVAARWSPAVAVAPPTTPTLTSPPQASYTAAASASAPAPAAAVAASPTATAAAPPAAPAASAAPAALSFTAAVADPSPAAAVTAPVSSTAQPAQPNQWIKTIHFERLEPSFDDHEMVNKIANKRPFLFLPGLDGIGNYSEGVLQNLTKTFDVWRMRIDPSDRSSFLQVSELVINRVAQFPEPPVLMGESFGGLVAQYIASRKGVQDSIYKLILVNPASSYDQTAWPVVGPLIASSGPAFPFLGIAALMATAVEREQFLRIGRQITDRINSTESAIRELRVLADSGSLITTLLPPETLKWRLKEWLLLGNVLMDDVKVARLKLPTLIITGSEDRLLPSKIEGRRLKGLLAAAGGTVELRELPASGHALMDDSFDLAALLRDSKSFRSDFSIDPTPVAAAAAAAASPYSVPFPTQEDLDLIDKQLDGFVKALSPVYLSRDKDGTVVRGLRPVPTGLEGRPVLLVGNHQLYGLDTGLIVRQFLREKNTLIRGLTHPVIFSDEAMQPNGGGGGGGAGGASMKDTFTKFGAVEVSPVAIFELLRRNETVLLFPGGVREAYHGKGEDYKLFWPETIDFVRMAGMMGAIIVPFGAVGIADSVNMLLDGGDIERLPYFGERAREFNKRVPQARVGVNQSFIAPVSIPKAPSRNYFLFGQPFDTRDLNIYDKKACRAFYADVKGEVEDAISTLVQFRAKDPYKDFLPRNLYESVAKRQAPTTSLNANLLRKKSIQPSS